MCKLVSLAYLLLTYTVYTDIYTSVYTHGIRIYAWWPMPGLGTDPCVVDQPPLHERLTILVAVLATGGGGDAILCGNS